jgi:hypothetical protein
VEPRRSTVKYILLFCGYEEDQRAFDALTPDELKRRYAEVGRWFTDHAARISSSGRLEGPHTATTVRFDAQGKSSVHDGPFIEGKEIIGGYCVVDVPDMDAALNMATTWPGRGAVEIRPMVGPA